MATANSNLENLIHSFIDVSFICLDYLKYVERGKPDFYASKAFIFPPVFSLNELCLMGPRAPPPTPRPLLTANKYIF